MSILDIDNRHSCLQELQVRSRPTKRSELELGVEAQERVVADFDGQIRRCLRGGCFKHLSRQRELFETRHQKL